MTAEVTDGLFTLRHSSVGIAGAQHASGAWLMQCILEGETQRSPAVLKTGHRPAGQSFCELFNVLLTVAAIDADGVQLEQLARVVLVEPAPATGSSSHGAT